MDIKTKLINLNPFNERLLSSDDIKIIEEFPNYAITNSGLVFNLNTGVNLKPYISNRGYKVLKFRNNNGGLNTRSIHRLVLITFGPEPGEGQTQANHIDGDKLNNYITNLEWVSNKENWLHAKTKLGRKMYGVEGVRLSAHKLTEEKAKEIRRLSKEEGLTYNQLAKRFGIGKCTAKSVVRGWSWREDVKWHPDLNPLTKGD